MTCRVICFCQSLTIWVVCLLFCLGVPAYWCRQRFRHAKVLKKVNIAHFWRTLFTYLNAKFPIILFLRSKKVCADLKKYPFPAGNAAGRQACLLLLESLYVKYIRKKMRFPSAEISLDLAVARHAFKWRRYESFCKGLPVSLLRGYVFLGYLAVAGLGRKSC